MRKRKFNLKEFISRLMSKFQSVKAYFLLIPFLFYFVNNFLLQSLVVSDYSATNTAQSLVQSLGIGYAVALVLIAYLLSKFDFKASTGLKIYVIYILYCLLSYLIGMTLNINNSDYRVWKLYDNHLYQENFLLTAALIIILTLVFFLIRRYYEKKASRVVKLGQSGEMETLALSQMLVSLILTDTKIPEALYRTGSFVYYNTGQNSLKYGFHHFWVTNGLLLAAMLVLSIGAYLFVKGLADLFRNQSSFSLAFFSSSIFAVVLNYSLQLTLGSIEPFLGIYYSMPGAFVFQIAILLLLFLGVYFILNNYWIATNVIVIVSIIFSVANTMKFSMRGEPILPSDLNWILSPQTLLGFVDLSQYIYIIVFLLALAAACWFGRKRLYKGKIISSWKYQLSVLVSLVACFSAIVAVFANKTDGQVLDHIPVISMLNNFQDTNWLGNTANARYKSLAYVWVNQLTTDIMERPDGYSKERIEAIEKKYKERAAAINDGRANTLNNQTLIYILSESFSDPSRVQGVNLSQDAIPYIRSVKEETTSGLMRSDGYGGGTANMEYQTLTGLPFYNMSQSVSVLYTEVFPKMNTVPSISNVFDADNRIAIHLAGRTNYSRNVVYSSLDFKDFITIETKGLDVQREGISPSDASTYNIVLDNLNTKENQFFSVMTMQNHSPWLEENPDSLEAQGEGFTAEENSRLTFYSRLLTQTDNATRDFLEDLKKVDKKVTVVFYGDHLPGLYPQSAFKDNPDSQYLTDYFVWSNYETPKLNYPVVNSSDFSALVLEQTNSKVSPYYALLTEVLHKASVNQRALDQEAQEIADELKLIEYDMVNGRGYLSQDFFKLPEK